MSKKVYIYALHEEGCDHVRYVGQTVNPKTRLNAHRVNQSLVYDNLKRIWVDDCKRRGVKVCMNILDECDPSSAVERERYWTDHYASSGHDLLCTYAPRACSAYVYETRVTNVLKREAQP